MPISTNGIGSPLRGFAWRRESVRVVRLTTWITRMESMQQLTLSTGGFGRYGKTARRAAFLVEMDRVVRVAAQLKESAHEQSGND